MSVHAQPSWFDPKAIEKALEREAAPDNAELRDILNKSLELQPLTMDETVALMRVQDGVGIGRIMAVADEVKQRVYATALCFLPRCTSRTTAAASACTAPIAKATRPLNANT